MKMNSLKTLAAAALAVLACSCNKEQAIETVQDGEEVNVSFVTEIPEIQTRAIGDGKTADLLQVYVYDDNGGVPNANITGLNTEKAINLATTVDFKLVKGKTYHFIFWAAKNGNSYYSVDVANKTIGIDYTGVANNEERDAFYAVKTLKVQGPLTETIKLYRPFSQVNFGTEDYEDAVKGGLEVTRSGFFATEAAKTLDVFAGEGKDAVEITYDAASIPAEDLVLSDGTHYKYMAMNYFIPVGKLSERHLSNVKGEFKDETGQSYEIAVPSAPVQANWRTNIIGRLLTDQVVFNIEIVPAFDGDIDIDINNIKDITSLKALFANGGSAVLTEDLVLDQTMFVPAGKEVVLDLNGKTISNTTDIWEEDINRSALILVKGGTLTIKGNGAVKAKDNDCFAVSVSDGGKLIIDGGEFVGNLDAVYVLEGMAEIRGGKFRIVQTSPGDEISKKYAFVLNCLDANYRNGTASIKVYGGQFVNFDPSNCLAEGANTNFLAEGYKSTKVLDTYYVSADDAAPVLPAAGQDELEDILANITAGTKAEVILAEGSYTLPSSLPEGVTISGNGDENVVIDGSATASVNAKNVTVSNVIVRGSGESAGGSSLAIGGSNCVVSGSKFENGRQGSYGSDLSVSTPVGSVTAIKDCDFRNSGFRGVMIWATGDEVKIDNCQFDNIYPFNVDGGTGKITVTNSNLKGWTSYTNTLKEVSFTNCKFGKSTSGFAYLRPYCKTVVKNCTFSSDFKVNPYGEGTYTVEFVNCKYEDGSAITSAIIDADGANENATVVIDGVTISY